MRILSYGFGHLCVIDAHSPVTTEQAIAIGVFEGFSWIRCEGKGSFLNSPVLKSFGDARIAGGERVLVVDLAACTGMDSTFMGTLAGMASRLAAVEGGVLQIAEACDRNRRSLEDLGLDFLMQIDPPEAKWRDDLVRIRAELKPVESAQAMEQKQRARMVLQAHEVLSAVNEKNAREFANVVETLKDQLDDGRKRES